MLNHTIRLLRKAGAEQNVIVKQRMDAVITGLIGGGTASLLLVVGGAVALFTDTWQRVSDPRVIFSWLCFLSALQVGQLYLTYVLVSAFAEVPSQTEKATVK